MEFARDTLTALDRNSYIVIEVSPSSLIDSLNCRVPVIAIDERSPSAEDIVASATDWNLTEHEAAGEYLTYSLAIIRGCR